MKKKLLLIIMTCFLTMSYSQAPQLDATISFELNSTTGYYRLQIVINQDISFKFSENYSSPQNAFSMIIKDVYAGTPQGGTSGGENTLNYVSTNAANTTGNSNGLGTYQGTYGPFTFPNDEQIGFGMTGTFVTDDLLRIKAGTIIQTPGNFLSVPAINPGPYTVVIANSAFNGIAATTVVENVLSSPLESISNNAIKMYPNPTKDFFFLESDEPILGLEIFNSSGSLVHKIEKDYNKINVSSLAQALYYLRIETNNGFLYKKLIVE